MADLNFPSKLSLSDKTPNLMPSCFQLPYTGKSPQLCNPLQVFSSIILTSPLSQVETSRNISLEGMTYPKLVQFLKVLSLNWVNDSRELLNSTKETSIITLRSCVSHCNKESVFLASGTPKENKTKQKHTIIGSNCSK